MEDEEEEGEQDIVEPCQASIHGRVKKNQILSVRCQQEAEDVRIPWRKESNRFFNNKKEKK